MAQRKKIENFQMWKAKTEARQEKACVLDQTSLLKGQHIKKKRN